MPTSRLTWWLQSVYCSPWFNISARPSVCSTNTGIVSKWMHISLHFLRVWRSISLNFRAPPLSRNSEGSPVRGALVPFCDIWRKDDKTSNRFFLEMVYDDYQLPLVKCSFQWRWPWVTLKGRTRGSHFFQRISVITLVPFDLEGTQLRGNTRRKGRLSRGISISPKAMGRCWRDAWRRTRTRYNN